MARFSVTRDKKRRKFFSEATCEAREPVVQWLPCEKSVVAVGLARDATDEEIIDRMEVYFQQCEIAGKRPLVTSLALAAGFNGPTEMRRATFRRPKLLPYISRALTLVAARYEDMIGQVSGSAPTFMLRNIPDFDAELPHEPPSYAFKETVEVDSKVRGFIKHAHAGAGRDLSPREIYLELVKGVTLENAEYAEAEEVTHQPRILRRIEQFEQKNGTDPD